MINKIRDNIKLKSVIDAISDIDDSELSLKEKYQLLKEFYRTRCVEFDINYRKNGMTFEEWITYDVDDWVGCFWPGDIQCNELEKYIYKDFLSHYKESTINLFNPPFKKVINSTFKYEICNLILEQILNHPVYIKGFDNLNENDIWFAIQWFLYTRKLETEESLIEYDYITEEESEYIIESIENSKKEPTYSSEEIKKELDL